MSLRTIVFIHLFILYSLIRYSETPIKRHCSFTEIGGFLKGMAAIQKAV